MIMVIKNLEPFHSTPPCLHPIIILTVIRRPASLIQILFVAMIDPLRVVLNLYVITGTL